MNKISNALKGLMNSARSKAPIPEDFTLKPETAANLENSQLAYINGDKSVPEQTLRQENMDDTKKIPVQKSKLRSPDKYEENCKVLDIGRRDHMLS